MDKVSAIIAYETDELDDEATLNLFAELVRTGEAWSLQGHYGRVARSLIEDGYLRRDGARLRHADGSEIEGVPPEEEEKGPSVNLEEIEDKRYSKPGNSQPRYDLTLPSFAPFMYVERRVTIPAKDPKAFKGAVLGIMAHGAYNAMGLIGTEAGGIAIVMEHPKRGVIATKRIPWDPKARDSEVECVLAAIRDNPEHPLRAIFRHVKGDDEYECRYDLPTD